ARTLARRTPGGARGARLLRAVVEAAGAGRAVGLRGMLGLPVDVLADRGRAGGRRGVAGRRVARRQGAAAGACRRPLLAASGAASVRRTAARRSAAGASPPRGVLRAADRPPCGLPCDGCGGRDRRNRTGTRTCARRLAARGRN